MIPEEGNAHAYQIASPDGKKIYYQKGPQGRQQGEDQSVTTLYEFDVNSGEVRPIAIHKGECPLIDDLRPSPDGKRLAYQVTYGCGFITVPDIYVLDLTTNEYRLIAKGTGSMHWSRSSERLYFLRRWLDAQDHGEYLWVAEFPKSPSTQPAQAQPDSTQPDQSQPAQALPSQN